MLLDEWLDVVTPILPDMSTFDLKKIFNLIDVDDSDSVSWDEFCGWAQVHSTNL